MRCLILVALLAVASSGQAQPTESGDALAPVPPTTDATDGEFNENDSEFNDTEFNDTEFNDTEFNDAHTPTAAPNSAAAVPPAPPAYGGPAVGGPAVGGPTYPIAVPSVQLRQTQLDPAVTAELTRLQTERNQLSLGGRIALMAGGFGATIISVVLANDFALEEELDTGCSRCGNNPGTIAFGTISIATFAVGIVGAYFFIKRLRQRRAIDKEMRDLRTRGVTQLALLEW